MDTFSQPISSLATRHVTLDSLSVPQPNSVFRYQSVVPPMTCVDTVSPLRALTACVPSPTLVSSSQPSALTTTMDVATVLVPPVKPGATTLSLVSRSLPVVPLTTTVDSVRLSWLDGHGVLLKGSVFRFLQLVQTTTIAVVTVSAVQDRPGVLLHSHVSTSPSAVTPMTTAVTA